MSIYPLLVPDGICEQDCSCGIDSAPDDEKNPSARECEQRELSLCAAVGAVLFASTRPLTAETLSEVCNANISDIEDALERIKTVFSSDVVGFSVIEIGGGFQLRTDPRAARAIQKLVGPKAKRLSRAAAETLAVVAYKQPVQRSEIEAIRGVDALPTLKTLLESKLIRIVGRGDAVGQPTLYGTTESFLERFGLRDLSELPSVRDIAQLAEDPGEADGSEIEQGAEEPGGDAQT
jgi:segregation and condensation protein B